MRWMFGSVRFRVTLVAAVLVALLLGVTAFVILRLVERDLIGEAEDVVNATINEVRQDLGVSSLPDDALLRYDTPSGPLFIGIVQEEDAVIGALVDPDTGEWLGELVLDPETGRAHGSLCRGRRAGR